MSKCHTLARHCMERERFAFPTFEETAMNRTLLIHESRAEFAACDEPKKEATFGTVLAASLGTRVARP